MMIDAVIGLGGFRSHATVAVSSAGELVAACPLERLTRVRGLGFRDAIWPSEAIAANLHAAGVPRDVMPDVLAAGPEFALFDGRTCRTVDHHNAHAASAFFTSPFDRAAVIVCDTSGREVSVWRGLRHTWADRTSLGAELVSPDCIQTWRATWSVERPGTGC